MEKEKSLEKQKVDETEDHVSQLTMPVWSVIGFNHRFASGLTYEEATAELRELSKCEYSGLCIVTDQAAARMRSKSVL